MNTRPGQLLIGGALLLGGIMGIYYSFRKKDHPSSSQKAVSKDLLIKILKDIEGERYLLYKKITPLCKQEYESRKAQMSLEDFTLSIFEEYQTHLNIEFAVYENRVLRRHNVLHTDYFEALNITYKDDEEITSILDESNIKLKQALQGEFRAFTDKLPSFATPEFMVELWEKVKKRTLRAMYKAVTEKGLKEDSKEIDEIDRETQVEVYKEEGLCELDEAADKIVQSGFYKYSREYPGFSEKIYQIDMKSIEVLTLLFTGGSDIEAKIETIGENI